MQHAEDVERKGHYEKVCLKGKCSTLTREFQQANSAGAGAGEPLYFSDEGQPIYTYMVSVPPCEQTLDQISYCIGNLQSRGARGIM